MKPGEFTNWAQNYQHVAFERVCQRLRHFAVLRHRHDPKLEIAEELALGGVKNALSVALNHHRRFPQVLQTPSSVLWLREEAFRQALRLLPEHPFVWPFLQPLGPDEYRLLYWLYVDQFNDRQLAVLLGISPVEARRRGWQAYKALCGRLVQAGWGSPDAALPVYPAEFGRSGLGPSGRQLQNTL